MQKSASVESKTRPLAELNLPAGGKHPEAVHHLSEAIANVSKPGEINNGAVIRLARAQLDALD